jgi:cell division protein FtsZ
VAKDAGFFESFRIADDVLRQGVQGISDIITIPGVINRDFADVKTTMAGMGYAVMGTAVRAGQERAVEAAMAAMASPLLESGAIDGAKGILINITGSSSLKLSEVNEASTIIQNAAHEDANIIFGAVQDESMGDEVKITVIATGFKQQEAPQRRERMLSESALPTARFEVPVQPRVTTSRPAAAVAVATTATPQLLETPEIQPTPMEQVIEARKVPVAEPKADPELVPVPASVFDDDFFQGAPTRTAPSYVVEDSVRITSAHFPDVANVQQDGVAVDAPVRVPFGNAAVAQVESSEADELDIPAFLRRGN